jgi:hypothetical protein
MLSHSAENRWQAFGIHLIVSFILYVGMFSVIFFDWYPGVLFFLEGGVQGAKLIAGIDFVIGPVLTLMVYKKGKKGLKMDLAIIGLLQVFCLGYGMLRVYNDKPIVIAYADNIFYPIPSVRFYSHGEDISQMELLKGKQPVRINIQLPENKIERLKIKQQRYPRLETTTERYEPFNNALHLMTREGFSLEEASKNGFEIDEAIEPSRYRVFKLFGRYGQFAVTVDMETGEMEHILGEANPLELGIHPK